MMSLSDRSNQKSSGCGLARTNISCSSLTTDVRPFLGGSGNIYRNQRTSNPSVITTKTCTSPGQNTCEQSTWEKRGCSLPMVATVLATSLMEPDDNAFLERMKQILEAFPMKGPPRNCVQISPHIFIGNQRNADDIDELRRLGITHVLNMAGTRRFDFNRSPYPRNSCIEGYLLIPAEDHEDYDIMRHFPDALNFLDKVKKNGGKALVHCNLGINRSGCICAAYLMHDERMSLLRVVQYLKMKRSVVLCNRGFRRQLIRYARVLSLLDQDVHMGEVEPQPRCQPQADYRLDGGRRHFSGLRETSELATTDEHLRSRPLTLTGRTRRPHSSPLNYCTLPRGLREEQGNRSNVKCGGVNSSSLSCSSSRVACSTENSGQLHAIEERSTSLLHADDESASCHIVNGDKEKDQKTANSGGSSYDKLPSNHLRFISWHHATSKAPENGKDHFNGDGIRVMSSTNLSTSRPLRVYRRSASDTQMYQRPMHTQYRRAETVATASDLNSAMVSLELGNSSPNQNTHIVQQDSNPYQANNTRYSRCFRDRVYPTSVMSSAGFTHHVSSSSLRY